jgi:hypothetical protein
VGDTGIHSFNQLVIIRSYLSFTTIPCSVLGVAVVVELSWWTGSAATREENDPRYDDDDGWLTGRRGRTGRRWRRWRR